MFVCLYHNYKTYIMKKNKKQFTEDLIAISIVGITLCLIIACSISIISNL